MLLGALGSWLGFQLADPLVGLGITVAILFILKDAARQIWRRLMDAVDPSILERAEAAARGAPGVQEVSRIQARWIGHSIHAEVLLVSDRDLPLAEAHAVGEGARHAMLHAVPKLAGVTVHVDPSSPHGEDAHARSRAPRPAAELAHPHPGGFRWADLCIVDGINLSGTADEPQAEGGVVHVIEDWFHQELTQKPPTWWAFTANRPAIAR